MASESLLRVVVLAWALLLWGEGQAQAPIRDECTGVFCKAAMCVDPVKEAGACCETCPQGTSHVCTEALSLTSNKALAVITLYYVLVLIKCLYLGI